MVESLRNLIDAANIAALAALCTFRRPECTVGGDDGQQVTVIDPEVGIYSVILLLIHFATF
jgi:exosome complex component RRP45